MADKKGRSGPASITGLLAVVGALFAPPASAEPWTQPLDGLFQFDFDWQRATLNGYPRPEDPETVYFAFRSNCTPMGCAANGIAVDANRTTRYPTYKVNFNFNYATGSWESNDPREVNCPDGYQSTPGYVRMRLQPLQDGSLHGEYAVDYNQPCPGVKTAPVSAWRIGDFPPGVSLDAW